MFRGKQYTLYTGGDGSGVGQSPVAVRETTLPDNEHQLPDWYQEERSSDDCPVSFQPPVAAVHMLYQKEATVIEHQRQQYDYLHHQHPQSGANNCGENIAMAGMSKSTTDTQPAKPSPTKPSPAKPLYYDDNDGKLLTTLSFHQLIIIIS